MKMKRWITNSVLSGALVVCSAFMLGAESVNATTSPTSVVDSIRIDLTKALEIAFSESPTIRIADRDIQCKQYARKEQIASLIPNLSASGSYQRAIKKQVMAMKIDEGTMKIEVGMDNTFNGGLNLSLPLIAPALWQSIKLTATDVALAVEKSRASAIDLEKSVKDAYYALLMAKDSYNVLLQNYKNVESNTKNIKNRYEQGLASEFEKIRAEVELKNHIPALQQAEAGIELAELQLKVIMGVDASEPIIFTGTLAEYESSIDPSILEKHYDLAQNTTLRQIDYQETMLNKQLKAQNATYLPTLALAVNYNYMTMQNDLKIFHYDWTPYSTAALSLSIPIFSGFSKQHKANQVKLNLKNLQDTRLNTERTLQAGLESCKVNIENAIENIKSASETVKMAEKAYEISKKQYEVGMGTWLDLNASEVALTSSKLSYHQAIYNYLTAVNTLDGLLGKTTINNEQ